MLEKIIKTSEFLVSKGMKDPDAGIVLGTGLGGLTAEIDIQVEIPYEDIPDFPVSTVKGHAGKQIAAPKGYGKGARFKAIEPAPGRYVKEKA